jgi:hypothetical protein
MRRPLRRFCFYLATRLKMTVAELLDRVDSRELTEWMAYELTSNEDWQKKYGTTKEVDMLESMTEEQRTEYLKEQLNKMMKK